MKKVAERWGKIDAQQLCPGVCIDFCRVVPELVEHALERMLERGSSCNMILDAASNGEVIEDYSADRPTPTALLLGWDKKRPFTLSCPLNPMEKLPSLPPMNQV